MTDATQLRQQILNAQDKKVEPIDVPEWGVEGLYIRVMTGQERDAFEGYVANSSNATKFNNLRARFCALVLSDEQGNRVFDDSDIGELGKKSGAALDRIFDQGRKINKLTDEDVEELSGKSRSVQSDGSGSG